MKIDLKSWQAGLVIVGMLAGGGWTAYSHFAKASDLVQIRDQIDRNADRNFRLRQQIINNTRTDREERGLNPNPRWLKNQQRQLNLERCLQVQRRNPRQRCNR